MVKVKKDHDGNKAQLGAMSPRTNRRNPRGSLRFALSNGRTIKTSIEDIMAIMAIMMEKRKQEKIRNLLVKIDELNNLVESPVSGQFGKVYFDKIGSSNVVFKLIPLEKLIMREDISPIEKMKIDKFKLATRSEIQFYDLNNGVQEFRNTHCPRRRAVQKTTECVAIIYDNCGPDMFSYLEKHRLKINPLGLLNLAIKVLKVFRAMFEAGIYHLDIKPENILYDGKRVMICDWGMWTMDADKIINQAGTLEFTAPLGHPARFYALWTIMATLAAVMFVFPPQYWNEDKSETVAWLNKMNSPECTKLEPLSKEFSMNCNILAQDQNYVPLCSLFRDFFSKTPKKSYTLTNIIDVFLKTEASVLAQSSP